MDHKFTSAHGIKDHVTALGMPGSVVGVSFTESKVTYDIDLYDGGETLRNVDSTFVKSLGS